MTTIFQLSQLGWTPFFQQQLSLDEMTHYLPARVAAQHRSHFDLFSEQGKHRLPISAKLPDLTVGDWLLLDSEEQCYRRLDRTSCFSRKAAGSKIKEQFIAANVDTVFIVCALNQDFSLNRIERYLAMTKEAGADPVVVLTKADLCPDPESYISQVQTLDNMLIIEAINALDGSGTEVLRPWCRTGHTVAVLGSSGVGKSTLINTLIGQTLQETGAARAADDKGRHTTTSRSLHLIPDGGVLLDTPGMRELQLAGCESGIDDVFADIGELVSQCRYNDCQHQAEPGCAVRDALQKGLINERRLGNYLKLMREQARNSATLAEKRENDRSLSRYYRKVLNESVKLKRGS